MRRADAQSRSDKGRRAPGLLPHVCWMEGAWHPWVLSGGARSGVCETFVFGKRMERWVGRGLRRVWETVRRDARKRIEARKGIRTGEVREEAWGVPRDTCAEIICGR